MAAAKTRPAAWAAGLGSDYRGLDLESPPLDFRALTVVTGPNNGGKTQFLRSCVLLEATRQVFLGSLRSAFDFSLERSQPVGSIAQALTNLGFRDLAEELAELLQGEKKVRLVWSITYADVTTLDQLFRQLVVDRFRIPPPERKKTVTAKLRPTFQVSLAYDTALNEIQVEKIHVEGLWEDIELALVSRKIAATNIESTPQRAKSPADWKASVLPEYQVSWFRNGEPLDLQEYVRRATTKIFPREMRERDYYSAGILTAVLRRVLSLLPEIAYVGPIRVADDRIYAVAADQTTFSVGRTGELTWVQLRALQKAPPVIKQALEDDVKAVLGLRNVESGREGVMRPKVTLQIGDQRLALHNYGLGTSQVLPLLVQLAIDRLVRQSDAGHGRRRPRQPRILIIEEPESHLHPAAQRALGAAFARYVRDGGKLVVESHSEVLLRAIELEIAAGRIHPTDCIVNWVDFRPEGLRSGPKTKQYGFGGDGGLEGTLPATFDQVIPELIEKRLSGSGA